MRDSVRYDTPPGEGLQEECLRHIQLTVPNWREIFDRVAAEQAEQAAQAAQRGRQTLRRGQALRRPPRRREESESSNEALQDHAYRRARERRERQSRRAGIRKPPLDPIISALADCYGGAGLDGEDDRPSVPPFVEAELATLFVPSTP